MLIKITPGKLSGTIASIGSKSDAHRALICAALADKPSAIEGMPDSEDIAATRQCLTALGAKFDGDTVIPITTLPDFPTLDCRESGSTLRFLLPVAAAVVKQSTFTGKGRLAQRPLKPLLSQMSCHGVEIIGDSLPLKLKGKLKSGEYILPGDVSSQYISGLLLSFPLISGDSKITLSSNLESSAYIDMTITTMKKYGVKVDNITNGWEISGGQGYTAPGKYTVDGDWSNAAFFLSAGVEVTGLNPISEQPDRAIVELLELLKSGGREIDVSQFPDLFPILAVTACATNGVTRLYGAGRLRLKESDRIEATASLINGLGGKTVQAEDSLTIYGTGSLEGGTVDSFFDHRIAMSAAIAATICKNEVIITNAEAVRKSYPSFWEDYRKLGGAIDVV